MISVIIPSFNGQSKLPTCLEAVFKQELKADEVIVVLDGSTDRSREVLKSWEKKLPLIVIEQENRGRAGARNAGAKVATGDILVFFDDDVRPANDSLYRHQRLISNVPGRISSGMVNEDANCSTEICNWRRYLLKKWFVNEELPRSLEEREIGLSAANFAISKKDFETLSGFSEEITDCEDFDFAVRAHTQGLSIWLDQHNSVVHFGFETAVQYALRQRSYRKQQILLRSLRSSQVNLPLYDKFIVKQTLFKRIVYFFIPGITLRWIDRSYFIWIPEEIRFSIYGRIFSALTVYYPERRL